ncbi:MAG: putative homocitrate synthase AksA [Methanomassiliicoccales archaeon PtaU1.Bin124]|nr:MAG: putative homocitrate synthase AksA [Methanomassiliicoccales archaeon PtaU1.Bin124]
MQQMALSPFNPHLDLKDVIVYDSTLRDGEQTPGMSFSPEQKLEIAEKLDSIGVHQIEAGFCAVSETEFQTVKEICHMGLKADILSLSRITRGDIDFCVDAGVDVVLLFIATSDIHLRYKFKKPREFILEKVQEGLDYCHERGVVASLSAEDCTRTDMDFLMQVYRKAEECKAARIGVTDTVGCASPEAIEAIVTEAVKTVSTPLSLHLHNDYGLAMANAIAGVKAGAKAVTTTVNGIGERAGNLPLEQFAATMKFVYGCDLGIDCSRLTEVCDLVAEYSRLPRPRNQPLVGPNVFAHESGIHVAAILECPLTYESISPEMVGNKRHILMGKHTGITYVRKRVEELKLKVTEEQLNQILAEVKSLGEKKGRVSDNEFRQIVNIVLDR